MLDKGLDEAHKFGELLGVALRHLPDDRREVLRGTAQPHVPPRNVLTHEMRNGVEMEHASQRLQDVLGCLSNMLFDLRVPRKSQRKLRRQ
ncbi:hypothetical protein Pth03_14710 [Planotetraspora thailandica]|uniref:Uncharacterized protein n=1 Tax=Planotetraspora thailandica TaxID=487172 RepID=A0A8J3V045_9ACTN|nr:hypothetical protein Pth03_14710 [Planotetraspora thailandica]